MRLLSRLVMLMLCLALTACGAVQSTVQRAVHPCQPVTMYSVIWSPDGTRLAYDMGNAVFMIDLDTLISTRLAEFGSPYLWSPNGTQLVFGYTGQLHSYLINVDGTGSPKELPIAPYSYGASWSPDGTEIVYVNYFTESQISVIDAGAEEIISIYSGTEDNRFFNPIWSPSGEQIAFSRVSRVSESANENETVFIINVDGTEAIQINTQSDLYPISLKWSPDSRQIAFLSWNAVPSLYIVNSDGTGLTRIAKTIGGELVWLPDMTGFIVISAGEINGSIRLNSKRQVQHITLDGTVTTLSDINLSATPAISPDATRIAYISDERGYQDLYVMNIDGTDKIRLTRNPGYSTCFDWPF